MSKNEADAIEAEQSSEKNNGGRHTPPLDEDPGFRGDTPLERVGKITAAMLLGCFIVEIAAVAFLAFLWYGTVDNSTWRSIVVHNWVPRAITLTSLALRISIAIQGAACLSMLAAITLETISVPLRNVAEISLMRSGNKVDLLSVVLNYLLPMFKQRIERDKREKAHRMFVLVSTLMILSTLTLSQFASTALLSDVKQQLISGEHFTSDLNYDYPFTNSPANPQSIYGSGYWFGGADNKTKYGYTYPRMTSGSYWSSKAPSSWPAFAEYSEAPLKADGVDDTGVSLRSFLPFADAQDRANIKTYNGKAMVLDSRVTCQKPKLSSLQWSTEGVGVSVGSNGNFDSGYGQLTGSVSPTKSTPRMIGNPNSRFRFTCTVAHGYDTKDMPWTVCQLPTWQNMFEPGFPKVYGDHATGLKSLLRAENSKNQTGAAFLIIGSSTGVAGLTHNPNPVKDSNVFEHFNEGSGATEVEFSTTLCFASYDVANREIEADSKNNRSEPSSTWDNKQNVLDMNAVLHQLDTGYASSKLPTPEERGVLRMKPRKDWTDSKANQVEIDGPDQLPYVPNLNFRTLGSREVSKDVNFVPYAINSMNVQGGALIQLEDENGNMNASWSAVMFPGLPISNIDGSVSNFLKQIVVSPPWVSNVFHPLIAKSRPAVALQALLTTMAGIGYYDRVTQYTKSAPVGQVFFRPLESPGGENGRRRTHFPAGFFATILILLIHLIMVGLVLTRFLTLSKLTRIGDGWQAIAHIALSDESNRILRRSATGGGAKAAQEHLNTVSKEGKQVNLKQRGGYSKFSAV